VHARLLPQRLNDVTFPNTAPAHHQQIGPAADEVAGGQRFHLHSVKCSRIEVPVESFQGFALGKARFPDAARHGAFSARAGFGAQQAIQKAEVRKAFFLGPSEELVQGRSFHRNPQSREMAQAAITK
jgi:hypothetical protein